MFLAVLKFRRGFLKLFFALLELRDIEADADDAAVRRAAFDNLTPAAVAVGTDDVGVAGAVASHALLDPRLEILADLGDDAAGGVGAQQFLVFGAGDQQMRGGGEIALRGAVAEDDAILAVAQHQARGHVLDRFHEAAVGFVGAPLGLHLFGHVAGGAAIAEKFAGDVVKRLAACLDETHALGRVDRGYDVAIGLALLDGMEVVLHAGILARAREILDLFADQFFRIGSQEGFDRADEAGEAMVLAGFPNPARGTMVRTADNFL